MYKNKVGFSQLSDTNQKASPQALMIIHSMAVLKAGGRRQDVKVRVFPCALPTAQVRNQNSGSSESELSKAVSVGGSGPGLHVAKAYGLF